MKTLEKYLKENIESNKIDFSVRATVENDGSISFYIHPSNTDGETMDFVCSGNTLKEMSQNKKAFALNDLPEDLYWKIYNDQRSCWCFGDEDTESKRSNLAELACDGAIVLTNGGSGLYSVEPSEKGYMSLKKNLGFTK